MFLSPGEQLLPRVPAVWAKALLSLFPYQTEENLKINRVEFSDKLKQPAFSTNGLYPLKEVGFFFRKLEERVNPYTQSPFLSRD